MSQVRVQGNASGTGILTVTSPNTNSNYTLTLPAQTGTILTNASPGTVLQVVQTIPTPAQVAVTNSGANYFVTFTTSNTALAFSGSITLSSASSKVLVQLKTNIDADTNTYAEYVLLFRSSTLLASDIVYRRVNGTEPIIHAINYLDSPATAGTVQYDIRFGAVNASPTLSFNRSNSATGGAWALDTTLILTEIAG